VLLLGRSIGEASESKVEVNQKKEEEEEENNKEKEDEG
jgi:hypothetical protein